MTDGRPLNTIEIADAPGVSRFTAQKLLDRADLPTTVTDEEERVATVDDLEAWRAMRKRQRATLSDLLPRRKASRASARLCAAPPHCASAL